MKFKYILVLPVLLLLALFVNKKMTKNHVHIDIKQKIIKLKQQNAKLTSEDKDSIFYILGYLYENPIASGKLRSEQYSKAKNQLVIRLGLGSDYFKTKLADDNFYSKTKNFLATNNELNIKLADLTEESIKHFDVIKNVSGVSMNKYSLSNSYHKFIKRLNKFIAYDYLTNKDEGKIKDHYLKLYNMVRKNEYTIVSNMLNRIHFKEIHGFVVKHNVFPTDQYINTILSENSRSLHKDILLSDRAITYIRYEKLFPWSADYNKSDEYKDAFYSEVFLKDYPVLKKAYVNLLDLFVPHTSGFNQSYTAALNDIDHCFENYEPCIDRSKEKPFMEKLGVMNSFFNKGLI